MADDKSNDGKPEDQNADAGADRTGDQTGDQDQRNAGNQDYPDDLGDAGKRAIDRMKSERDEANRKARETQAELERLRAASNNDGSDRNGGKGDDVSNDGKTGDDTKPEGKSAEQVENELMARFAQQALRSAVREVASAKLADPNDALVLADFSDIKPNDYGEFDRSAIEERVTKLTESKPYLAKNETKFEGSADSGNRGAAANGQISRDALKSMSSAEIEKARREGRLSDILSGK